MKKNLLNLVLAIILLSSSFAFSQCPVGDVILNSQSEVDNFIITYPACTTISGNLGVYGADITNLDGLSNITTITGYVDFESNLSLLTDWSGLDNLSTLNGALYFYQANLTTLPTLNNLTIIGGDFVFSQNTGINSAAFNNITTINGYVDVGQNTNLTAFSMASLTSSGGLFTLYSNPILTSVDFTSLLSTGGYLFIEDNNSLTNLSGFSGLTTINNYLDISNNPLLTDISNLNNLVTITGFIQIENNAILTSLTGLDNVNPLLLTGLNLISNVGLATCNVASLCSYLSGGGSSSISGNATGCNNASEVSAACSVPCPNDMYFAAQADVDDFGTTYAHCNTIAGNLGVYGADITNLDGLSHITTIGGYADFETDLSLLNDWTGLDNLSTLSGPLYIYQATLSSMPTFNSLTSIGGDLVISQNIGLTSIVLNNITTVGGYIDLGLNTNLTSLSMSSLTSNGNLFALYSNPLLTTVNFNSLTTIGGYVFLESNDSLTDLSGFSNLTTVSNYLDISNNASLTSVSDLSNLTNLNGLLYIENNAILTNLTGLDNINPLLITGLSLISNVALSTCNVPSICTYLSNGGGATIVGNAVGCNNATQISNLCNFSCATTTTWDGLAWDNGVPTSTAAAIFSGDYSSTGDLIACTVTIQNADVVFNTGDDFVVSGAISVDAVGSLTFENNANLTQDLDVSNIGKITTKRETSIRRLDYTYWGSPVMGQDLKLFSPYTISPTIAPGFPSTTGNSRFYTINEATNSFQAITEPLGTDFDLAKGYAIRAPNNFPTAPQTFFGTFTGVPNNGQTTIAITNSGQGFNLIGNPYPSPIDADMFLAQNPGSLYFWTHINQAAVSGANYATYSDMGYAAATGGPAPNGLIQTGQGFLLLTATPGFATFTNDMRIGDNTGQFFRTSNEIEKHRIWLNLFDEGGMQNQILVGYMTGATMEVDVSIDAKQIESDISNIASIIDGKKYNIQGRSLPFENTDEIPLSFNALNAGTFTIAIDHFDGLFTDQDVFIKDNIAGITHNIKESAYTFASEAGTTTNRFSVVFQDTTLAINPFLDASNIIVFKQNNVLNINSGKINMAAVKIFDTRGRLIFEQSNINSNAATLTNLNVAGELLLVQITSVDNRIYTKKIVY
ncbi:MAG: T9SS sorting signal type C domain-containing protein [Flavobacterium sp.]|nr:T9SS sorting signal type C domain-containing protein [Flavobacterium sp.]